MKVFMIAVKFSFILLIGVAGAALFWRDNEPVLIQSLESKNLENGPVFNKIAYFSGAKQDVWMMNQSHYGINASDEKWDRLAIVVNIEGNVKSAKFLQLPPGELKWSNDLYKKEIPYKVSCFICHSNGPRAIRADEKNVVLKFNDKLKIYLWNLRIKTYGKIVEDQKQAVLDLGLKTPFRFRTVVDNEKLNIASCTSCHNGNNVWPNRNILTRQNSLGIDFMLTNKLMPPLGFKISLDDELKLKKFLLGI